MGGEINVGVSRVDAGYVVFASGSTKDEYIR